MTCMLSSLYQRDINAARFYETQINTHMHTYMHLANICSIRHFIIKSSVHSLLLLLMGLTHSLFVLEVHLSVE